MNTVPKTKTPETDGVEKSLWLRYKQAEDITPEDNARELLRESLFFARRLEEERDQARAELQKWKEQLSLETAGGPTGDLMRTSRAWQSVRSERDQLRDQLAQRDEALKVANGALEISADCFNRIAHGDEEITSGQAESLLCETRNALRRIEELTKEKQPHE